MHDRPASSNFTPEPRSRRPFNRLLQYAYTSPVAMATTTSMVVLLVCLLWSLPLALAAGQVVRIGIYQNSPKVTYSETGQPAGMFVDLIDRHLARMKQDRQSVYYRSLNRWTSEELDLSLPSWVKVAGVLFVVVLLLSFAGAALFKRQNARTLQLRQRNEEMAIINRTLRAISGSLDLSRVLEEAIRGALRLTGFDGGVFCLRDTDNGELRVGAGIHACADTDRAPDGGPMRYATCPGMLEQVARQGRMILQSTDTTAGHRACANMRDDGVHWNAFFLLKSQGQTIGLLCLYSRQPEAPVQRHLDMVRNLCFPVALENARLYEQVSQHARELEDRVAEWTRELGEREATTRAFADEQRLLLEHIPVGILFTGDGRILRANPNFPKYSAMTTRPSCGWRRTKVCTEHIGHTLYRRDR